MKKPEIIRHSKYTLRKLSKPNAKHAIRDNGFFRGFITGNFVNPLDLIADETLGLKVNVTTLQEFERKFDAMQDDLELYTPWLGKYPSYYQIIAEKGD